MFATEAEFDGNGGAGGYSEEVLALAIVMTAFVALLIGLCLGIFVTRQCTSSANHLHHATSSKEKRIKHSSESNTTSNNDCIHKYSVTTISSTCNESNKSESSFNQISAYESNSNTG